MGAAAAGVGCALVVLAVVGCDGNDPPSSRTSSSSVAPDEGPRADDTGPFFKATDAVLSSELYFERVADQVDARRQQERVNEVRFRLRSRAIVPEWGSDQLQRPRESWAVPLGITTRPDGKYLAVATTRCVVDYRYPTLQDRADWANLALFTSTGRTEEVFRISQPATLPGSRVYDQQREALVFTGRYHLSGAHGDRYFGQLAAGSVPGVIAELPLGDWSNSDGVDIAVLLFPLGDPGVRALDTNRYLSERLADPVAEIRRALEGRTSFMGDTFEYSLVSAECMRGLQEEVSDLEAKVREANFRTLLVVTIALALVAPTVVPAVLEAGTSVSGAAALAAALARRLGPEVAKAAAGAIWRTVARTLINGEAVRDVLWDEAGNLAMTLVRPDGQVEKAVLAGLTQSGLDEQNARRVVETVRLFLERSGLGVAVMRRENETSKASLFDPARQVDLAAELLRRGLVRLDTRNREVLAQQRALVRAARDALTDPATRDANAVRDRAYASAITELVAALGL